MFLRNWRGHPRRLHRRGWVHKANGSPIADLHQDRSLSAEEMIKSPADRTGLTCRAIREELAVSLHLLWGRRENANGEMG